MTRLDRDAEAAGSPTDRASRTGTWILAGIGCLFTAMCLPIVVRGAPLADDFFNCLRPQQIGLGAFLAESLERLGALRRAHFLEILITTETCQYLPFGVAIAVPLVITLAIAVLLRGLLRDLRVPEPWPSIGGALWLLQPLGTEAALWPAAMHVGLGLALALTAIRLHRGGHHGLAAAAVAAAGLSVEQVVLAMPIAVWAATTGDRRRIAVMTTVGVTAVLLAAFVVWPGDDPRIRASVAARLAEAFGDPAFLVRFPAVGLGLHSISLAVWWLFPLSVLGLAIGGASGFQLGQTLRDAQPQGWPVKSALLSGVLLIIAVNAPVVLAVPHQGSPRIFTPTWLVLSGVLAYAGPAIRRPLILPATVLAGVFAAGASMSIALSVWVRWQTADFTVAAAERIAGDTSEGSALAVCGITRTVVDPAPRGAFAVHEFIDEGTARDSLEYYTDTRATFLLAGPLWPDRPCPPGDVDRVIAFRDLLQAWGGR